MGGRGGQVKLGAQIIKILIGWWPELEVTPAMPNQHDRGKRAVTYRLDLDLVARVAAEAARQGVCQVDVVRAALDRYLPEGSVAVDVGGDVPRRLCERPGCARELSGTARSDARFCSTRCQVADWRARAETAPARER